MSAVDELLAELDERRGALYALVRAHDPAALARRPESGEWSVIENLRHLLYAEQRHIERILPGRTDWSPIGLAPNGQPRKTTGVGTQQTDDLDQVLATWDATHARVRAAAHGVDGIERAITGNLGHLRSHTRIIESLVGVRPPRRGSRSRRDAADR